LGRQNGRLARSSSGNGLVQFGARLAVVVRGKRFQRLQSHAARRSIAGGGLEHRTRNLPQNVSAFESLAAQPSLVCVERRWPPSPRQIDVDRKARDGGTPRILRQQSSGEFSGPSCVALSEPRETLRQLAGLG